MSEVETNADAVEQSLLELQDIVRCRCHPAYTGRGLRDPACECDSAEAVKIVVERIEELQAKLAKAVGALHEIAGKKTYADDPWGVARAALAELKGQDDE